MDGFDDYFKREINNEYKFYYKYFNITKFLVNYKWNLNITVYKLYIYRIKNKKSLDYLFTLLKEFDEVKEIGLLDKFTPFCKEGGDVYDLNLFFNEIRDIYNKEKAVKIINVLDEVKFCLN